MFGQIYAHLYRDPGSKPLFEDKPHVVSWINRMLDPDKTKKGNFLRDDEVPATLKPILKTLFAEQFEFSQSVVDNIQKFTDDNPQAKRVSRIIGESDFMIGGVAGKRSMFSFVQWKVQRVWDALHCLKGKEADDAKEWLQSINGDALINLDIRHRLKRVNFHEILER
jgi:hypothetical protein